jgi:hypothetical protein
LPVDLAREYRPSKGERVVFAILTTGINSRAANLIEESLIDDPAKS